MATRTQLPPDALALAQAHRLRQQQIAMAATQQAAKLWAYLDTANLAGSWAGLAPRILQLVTAALLEASRGSQDYVSAAVRMWGAEPDPVGQVAEWTFASTASDGRPLGTLLGVPAFEAQSFVDQGMDATQAKTIGDRHLKRIVATQVADAARVPTGVAQVNDRKVRGYVRMVTPPSCARCVVLAGRFYRTNSGFLRHPQCDCVMIPAAEHLPDLTTDPKQYFDSLSPAEQDRAFTAAGAQAIRDGADISRTVNARRGMYEAGGRKFTTEATTRRGIGRAARLMPEQIYLEAGGDRDEALRLLRLHGYVTGRPTRILRPVEPPSPHPGIDKLPRIVRPYGGTEPEERSLMLNHDARGTNPSYGQPGYNINCVHVVAAHELRRRGYDVTASPLPEPLRPNRGRNHVEAIHRWRTPDGNLREPKYFSAAGAVAKEIESWPDGARGWVRISWAKKYGGGGHIFNVEKIDGEVRYLDAQLSRAMLDFRRDYASRATRGPYAFDVTRVDDLTPTDDVLEFVKER